MLKFRVIGASRMGQDVEVIVGAASLNDAAAMANEMGVHVSRVEPCQSINTSAPFAQGTPLPETLQRLSELHAGGVLNADEFQAAKARLLRRGQAARPQAARPQSARPQAAPRPTQPACPEHIDPNANEFYMRIADNKQSYGPYSASHVEHMRSSNALHPQAMIAHKSNDRWVPVASFGAGALVGLLLAEFTQSASAAGVSGAMYGGAGGAAFDTNNDGLIDVVGVDSTGDGMIDTVAVDTNYDGVADGVAIDTNADGVADVVGVDSTGDGFIDAVAIDANYDGVADAVVMDIDGDGIADVIVADVDFDGAVDIAGGIDIEEAGGGFFEALGDLFG